jgi:hypothetical protein
MAKNHKTRAGVMVQVVEHLPCQQEALSSNSSTAKKRTKGGGFAFHRDIFYCPLRRPIKHLPPTSITTHGVCCRRVMH